MRKQYLLLLLVPLFLGGCSWSNSTFISQNTTQSVGEASFGKYEVPNGKEYELFQSGSVVYYKKADGSLSDIYQNQDELKKFLDSKNSLVFDKIFYPTGKEYQLTQYKGVFGYLNTDGTKADKTFPTQDELKKFLDANNPICTVTISKPIGNTVQRLQVFLPSSCGKGKTVDLSTVNDVTGEIGFGSLKLVSGNELMFGSLGFISSNKPEEVENTNGLKGLTLAKPGLPNPKDVEGLLSNLGCPDFSAGSECLKMKQENMKSWSVNGSFGDGLDFVAIAKSEELAQSIYNEVAPLLKGAKKLATEKTIDWTRIQSIKLGDKKGKVLIFTDKFGVKKTISNIHGWGFDLSADTEIVFESYNQSSNTIIITPLVGLHFNDSFILNLNTGVVKNSNTGN